MANILFIHHTLQLGGGEKYIKELVDFAVAQGHRPSVLIPNRLGKEYYDDYFESIGVKVIRFKIYSFMNYIKEFYSKNIFYNIYFKLFLKSKFDVVHFVNLSIASHYVGVFKHPNTKIWHVGNAVQYPGYSLPFDKNIFLNPAAEIICINEYQVDELRRQFEINCKITLFKLFLND